MSGKLGGKSGTLRCEQCRQPRYPGVTLCPTCWRQTQIPEIAGDDGKNVHQLGGPDGSLRCACGQPRWPNCEFCPTCWGEQHPGHGTRNSRNVVIQERLPKDLWMATQFAASMIHKGTAFHTSVIRAAEYYHVEATEVQRALAQRSGRNNTGKKRQAE